MGVNKVLKDKVKAIDKGKLNAIADKIAEINNVKSSVVKRDMIKNFLKYGIGYTDYLKGDYFNLTKEQKETFVTTKSYYKILNYLNDKRYMYCFFDKMVFNKIFHEYSGRELFDLRFIDFKSFETFFKKKKEIIVKPICEFGSHGVERFKLKDVDDLHKLYNRLKSEKRFIVEEIVSQHDELNKLNPYALNPFRIVTLVKDNKAYVIGNALRIQLNDEDIVGCHDAYMRIGDDGKIVSRVLDDFVTSYEEHPLTHQKFSDITIPFAHEAFEMAKKAALEVPEVRYVGWDIAISKNGPLILEGNEWPSYGLIQYYMFNDEKEGHLKTLENILGDELKDIIK